MKHGLDIGMAVLDADGRRLGKVTRCDSWGFEVQRGFWGPREWVIRYDEILELGVDSVKVARSDAALFELAAGGLPHAWAPVESGEADGLMPATPAEREATMGTQSARSPAADPRRA